MDSDNPAGFFFLKDGNETNTLRYELEVCFLEFSKRNWSSSYDRNTTASKKMTLGSDISCGGNQTTKIVYDENGKYTLTIPTTTYTSYGGLGFLGDYPKYLRYYYVCIKILGGQNLEEGTYTSSFYVSSSDSSIPRTKYTIKGYVGEKPIVESTDFSFFVEPSLDSYFTDLVVAKTTPTTPSPSKSVASLQFYYTRKGTYSSEPSENTYKKKFTIYISPTNDYTKSGRYVFKKTGTENQSDSFANRIYYEIDTTSTTGLTKNNNDTDYNTYYFYPDYSSQLLSSSGNSKNYQEFWKLEGKQIYIRVSEDSQETNDNMHLPGTYSSTIWFTIVPNDSL